MAPIAANWFQVHASSNYWTHTKRGKTIVTCLILYVQYISSEHIMYKYMLDYLILGYRIQGGNEPKGNAEMPALQSLLASKTLRICFSNF